MAMVAEALLGHPFAVLQRVYYPCVCAIGIPANLITTLTLMRRSCGLSQVTRTYLVALALADSLTLACLGVLDLSVLWLQAEPFWAAYPWCGLLTVLEYGAMFSSIWIIVAFTVERFLSVARPGTSGPGASSAAGGPAARGRSKAAALRVTVGVFAASYVFAVPGFWLNVTEVRNVSMAAANVTGLQGYGPAAGVWRGREALGRTERSRDAQEVWVDATRRSESDGRVSGGGGEVMKGVEEVRETRGNLTPVRDNGANGNNKLLDVKEVLNVTGVLDVTEVLRVAELRTDITTVQTNAETAGSAGQPWHDASPKFLARRRKTSSEYGLRPRSTSLSSSRPPSPPSPQPSSQHKQSQRCHHNESPFAEAVVWTHTLASGAVPFSLVLAFNGLVVWRLRARAFVGPRGPLRAKTRRSVVILLSVSAAFVGLSLPRFVTYCVLRTAPSDGGGGAGGAGAGDRNDFSKPINVVADVAIMMHLANSAVNCFVYCLASAAFRAEMVAMLAAAGKRCGG